MVGWLVNNFWKGCGSEQSWSNLKYFPDIFLERLRRIANLTFRIFSVSLRFEPSTSRVKVWKLYGLSQHSLQGAYQSGYECHFFSLCLYITCNFLNFIHFYNEDGGIIFLQSLPAKLHIDLTPANNNKYVSEIVLEYSFRDCCESCSISVIGAKNRHISNTVISAGKV